MEKMSLTKALVEIKMLEKKIVKQIDNIQFVTIYQKRTGESLTSVQMLKTEYNDKAKETQQAIDDLVKRRQDIKKALLAANNNTLITIGNSEISIAAAIDMKNIIKIKKEYLKKMNEQYAQALNYCEEKTKALEEQIDKMLEANLGGNKKADKEAYEAIAKPFFDANQVMVYDPLNIKKIIEKLEKEIEDFEKNIDFALSEINAKTIIEI